MKSSGAKMINKIVRRSMGKKRGLIIAISLLIVVCSLFVGLTHFVYDSMDSNYQQLQKDTNVEDFRLYPLSVSKQKADSIYTTQMLNKLEDKYEMNLEEQKLANYRPDDRKKRNYGISKFNKADKIDTILLASGELPLDSNEIIMQPQAAKYLNIKPGDKLKIADKDYELSGTGYFSTEIMPADFANNIIYPDFDKYIPIYMSESGFNDLDKNSVNLSFSTIYKGKFDKAYTSDKRMEIYDKIIADSRIEIPVLDDNSQVQVTSEGQVISKEIDSFIFAQDRSINPNISSVEGEVKGTKTTFTFLASILSIITIFLAAILINSVFKAQRREIGIMKAEGISINKLGLGFVIYILVLIFFASIVGGFLSIYASMGMRNMYQEIFMLKDYKLANNVVISVVKDLSIIAILMIIVIYFISIRRNLKIPTLQLIKNISIEKAPKHNLSKLFSKFSFIRKYQINLLLRNVSKTLLLSFAVFVSSFMLLLGILTYTSINDMMDDTYGEHFQYNYQVQYSENNIKNENQVTDGYISVEAKLKGFSDEVELKEPLKDEDSVQVEAYDFDNSKTIHLNDTSGKAITNDLNGLIASSGFLKKYNLAIGDEIIIENPYKMDEELKLPIVSETNDFFLPYVYAPLDYFQSSLGIRDNMINAYHGKEKLTNEKRNQILQDDPGAVIFESSDLESMMGDSLNLLNLAIIIIAVLAAFIAFVALYAISSVIIDSNSKTISVMKVLGYTSKEVRIMTIGIYKYLVILIYIISIPLLQYLIQISVNHALADMDFNLTIKLNYFYSLIGLVIIVGVYLIASKLTYRKIEKIKLAESLKADE